MLECPQQEARSEKNSQTLEGNWWMGLSLWLPLHFPFPSSQDQTTHAPTHSSLPYLQLWFTQFCCGLYQLKMALRFLASVFWLLQACQEKQHYFRPVQLPSSPNSLFRASSTARIRRNWLATNFYHTVPDRMVLTPSWKPLQHKIQIKVDLIHSL